MVEFALSLPLVIMVSMYGLEIAWVAIQQQKINQIAAVTADNAARVRSRIDETNVREIMSAARLAGQTMRFEQNGRVILSSIQQNPAANGQWIRWQRCEGDLAVTSRYGAEGKGRTDTTLPGVGPGSTLRAPAGNSVMLVEIQYNYQPLISNKFYGAKVLKSETAYLVRDRTDLAIYNSANLAANQILTMPNC